MAEIDETDSDGEPYYTIPHVFEQELLQLVTRNHGLVIDAIAKEEREEIAEMREMFDDHEAFCTHRHFLETSYSDMRQAANQLALVGLVTRLQHWVALFAESLSVG